jgi:hypothetical protein
MTKWSRSQIKQIFHPKKKKWWPLNGFNCKEEKLSIEKIPLCDHQVILIAKNKAITQKEIGGHM